MTKKTNSDLCALFSKADVASKKCSESINKFVRSCGKLNIVTKEKKSD